MMTPSKSNAMRSDGSWSSTSSTVLGSTSPPGSPDSIAIFTLFGFADKKSETLKARRNGNVDCPDVKAPEVTGRFQ